MERGSGLLHGGPAGTDPRVRGSARRRLAVSGRSRFAGRWRLCEVAVQRTASGDAAGQEGDFRSRAGDCRAERRGPRQSDHATGGRSGKECRALEEASVPDEFPGSGSAQAGRDGAGGRPSAARRADPAVDRFRITAAGGRRYSRRQEAGAGRCCSRWRTKPRDVLHAVAALAGERYAAPCDRVDSTAAAGR